MRLKKDDDGKFKEIFDKVYDDILEVVIHNNLVGGMSIIAFLANNILLIYLIYQFVTGGKISKIFFWIIVFEFLFTVIIFTGFVEYFRANKKLTWPQVIGMSIRQTAILFLTSFTILYIIFFLIYIFIARRKTDNVIRS